MKEKGIVRREEEADYQRVEAITRKAFYNLYVPGCHEHYLVHVMREHEDFLPELDLVIEADGQVVGSILYTKNRLVDESGEEKAILTFGPVCVAPDFQRQGYGKRLMEESFRRAAALGWDTIVIFGNPGNYVSRGFKSCKKYNVCLEGGVFPAAMLVKELKPARWTAGNGCISRAPCSTWTSRRRSGTTTASSRWKNAGSQARKNSISTARQRSRKSPPAGRPPFFGRPPRPCVRTRGMGA